MKETDTTEKLENGYEKDKKFVYFTLKVRKGIGNPMVQGADSMTFRVLKGTYARDKNQVYYFGRAIGEADISMSAIPDA